MHIHSRLFNHPPSTNNRIVAVGFVHAPKTLLTAVLVAAALSACGKAETPMTTADRVKIVEEKQKSDPNFYQEKNKVEAKSNAPTIVTPAVPATVQVEPSKASAKM